MGISTLRRLLGHRRWRPVVLRPDSRAALSLSYLAFKDLITSNDEFLELVADVELKLEGQVRFDSAYVRLRAVTCATRVYRMVMCLNRLSSRRYQELDLVFSSIERRIEALLNRRHEPAGVPAAMVYPLSALDAALSDLVGGKAAHIGDVANKTGVPVPDGFAVSTRAFITWLGEGDLRAAIRARQAEITPDDVSGLNEISRGLQQLITGCPVPSVVADAILEAYDALGRRLGFPPHVAVRSSAVGEDGDTSFAGQYTSLLNVTRDGLIDAYREVVASLYSPAALFYRAAQGFPDDLPMAALCMVMVEATASGVACSVNPSAMDSDTVVIAGSWGLGVGTAGGSVSADTWEVSRANLSIVRAREGSKDTSLEADDAGGVRWVAAEPARAGAFCLSDDRVVALARLVLTVEAHYHRPQEVEWAVDSSGRFSILQSRPLRAGAQPAPSRSGPAAIVGHEVLLSGVPASTGSGSGPVRFLSESDEAGRFPPGAVLVARHSSPQFVRVMPHAAAIITDIGAATGHMASLAREFGVPAVVDTRVATTTLHPDQVVTVDATRGIVYQGVVTSLLAARANEGARTMRGTRVYDLLRRVADSIVPLNLVDPSAASFCPASCRTLHDVARFAHEKAFEQMFRMSDRVADVTHQATRLDERLPFELYVIDIGGGLRRQPAGAVTLADVASEPMLALLRGMTNPALRWGDPRRVSLSGFLSVATESLMAPRDDATVRRLGERSYAIVAEAYCNFSSRIGYHFAAVDAYCGESPTRNYVSFRFKGGAADDLRRAKRCELIKAILARLDFHVEQRADLVNARLRKYPRDVILDRLDHVGRLLVATRQLDMRMAPGAPVEWFVEAFFGGNYQFDDEANGGGAATSRPGAR